MPDIYVAIGFFKVNRILIWCFVFIEMEQFAFLNVKLNKGNELLY